MNVLRNRKLWMALMALVMALGVAACCCDEVLNEILSQYDYVLGFWCYSSSEGEGCVTPLGMPHIQIKSNHAAGFQEACRYRATPDVLVNQVAFQVPAGTELADATPSFTFNGETIGFFEDPEAAQQVQDLFGGTWVAFTQEKGVRPSRSNVMDSATFSYQLCYTTAMAASGEPLPQVVTYQMAMFDAGKGQWVRSPTTAKVDYPDVVVSITDQRELQPWECSIGDVLLIDEVHVKNTGTARPAGSMVDVLIQDGGKVLKRTTVRVLPALQPWDKVTLYDVEVDLRGFGAREYVVKVEVTDPDGNAMGAKNVGVRVANPQPVTPAATKAMPVG